MPYVSAEAFRKNFPILQDMVYLSSCSLGARSTQLDRSIGTMLDAMSDGADAWQLFEEQVTEARTKFARLIGARPGQIAVMPNASVGAYQIASCIDWSEQPEILTSMAEFPSIAHVWMAQRERGARVAYAKAVEENAYIDAIRPDTGLVSIPLVAYSDSRMLDARMIAKAAHDKGARVFVDAYQALGVQPIDVNALGCDFLVAGASKYLLGLPGVAFVYERARREDDHTPQLTGWFGQENPFAFDPCSLDFAKDARRYETGTPSVPALYAANAGLDLLLGLNLQDVRSHVSGLVGHVQDRLRAAGVEHRGPQDCERCGAHVALHDPQVTALAAHLADANIRISPRGDLARLAFHFYNTTDDADAVCDQIVGYKTLHRRARISAACTKAYERPIRAKSPQAWAQAGLARWRKTPKPSTFPFAEVISAYHENGKEFVGSALLAELDEIRDIVPTLVPDRGNRTKLKRFLDVALDKFDGTYEYPSYCALPLWPLPTNPGETPDVDDIDRVRDRQLLALTADSMRFELDARNGRTRLMPDMRPDTAIYKKRVRLGLNSARFAIERLGLPVDPAASAFEAEAESLCDIVFDMLTAEETQALMLTMQPVYTVHDEYLFLRVLQAFETNFAWMAVRLQSAIDAFDTAPFTVAALIHDANRMYREASKIFPVLATMQRESFQVFRDYTEGASAIQSRNYKLVESLCRSPDDERRDGLAYRSVPEVRNRVLDGQDSLDSALSTARAAGALDPQDDAEIVAAMDDFSKTLQQWRQIHYRLAVKMLGEETSGTGATEGTPYLSGVRSIPVFNSIGLRDMTC